MCIYIYIYIYDRYYMYIGYIQTCIYICTYTGHAVVGIERTG